MVSRPNRSRRLRRSVPFGLVSVAALVAGCELAETVAPQLESRAVVHAVLNPLATQQLVIVEKTLRSLSLDPG